MEQYDANIKENAGRDLLRDQSIVNNNEVGYVLWT